MKFNIISTSAQQALAKTTTSQAKKIIKEAGGESKFFTAVLNKHLDLTISQDDTHGQAFNLMQRKWYQTGKDIVFFESKSLVDRLVNMNTKLTGEITHLDLPSDSFILSIPKGVNVNGVLIKSLLVSYESFDELQAFHKQNERMKDFEFTSREDTSVKELSICYMSDDGAYYSHCNLTMPRLQALVSSKNYVEYEQAMRKLPIDCSIENDYEAKEQFSHLKLVVNMSIYLNATKDTLVSGLPRSFELGKKQSAVGDSRKFSVIANKTIKSLSNQIRMGITVVLPLYRNLVHEKYYKTEEWSDKPIGSRWVEVASYVRGDRNITPKTVI